MAKQTGTGDSTWPETTWGTGEGVGAMSTSNQRGRGHTLDPRKRCAPPVGANVGRKRKKLKARSSITPW